MSDAKPKSRRGGPRPNSGGARPGAGRKPLPEGVRYVAISVTLSPEHYAQARALGEGNVSAGLRVALDAHGKRKGR